MNVLVFAPHPDDEVIGCGGSLIHHVKHGDNVTLAYITSGDAGDLQIDKNTLAKIREKEAHAAASILGVHSLEFLHLPDGYVEYNNKTLKIITDLIRKLQPDIVYMPHRHDSHSDHVKTHEIVYQLYDEKKSVEAVVHSGIDVTLVKKIQKRVEENAFKHHLPLVPEE